ncbi:MAG: NUDIX domain-containing protein [Bacteroidota bacterium]
MKTYPIRVAVKAIIVQDGKLLLNQYEGDKGTYYRLPGGGQENGENMIEALQRECMEEIGAKVEVGELVKVRDYIARNHTTGLDKPEFHQVEMIFTCSLAEGEQVDYEADGDYEQVGVRWLNTSELTDYKIFPRQLGDWVAGKGPIYAGDVN